MLVVRGKKQMMMTRRGDGAWQNNLLATTTTTLRRSLCVCEAVFRECVYVCICFRYLTLLYAFRLNCAGPQSVHAHKPCLPPRLWQSWRRWRFGGGGRHIRSVYVVCMYMHGVLVGLLLVGLLLLVVVAALLCILCVQFSSAFDREKITANPLFIHVLLVRHSASVCGLRAQTQLYNIIRATEYRRNRPPKSVVQTKTSWRNGLNICRHSALCFGVHSENLLWFPLFWECLCWLCLFVGVHSVHVISICSTTACDIFHRAIAIARNIYTHSHTNT